MKIGLLIAIERELEAFLASGEARSEEAVAGRTVYKTRMEGHDVYAVQSGCGEIDASSATMLLIVKYGCDIIVNFGVAGALDADLKVEDLFAAEKVWHYDFDITSFSDTVKVGQYAEYPDEFIPLDAGLVNLVTERIPGIRKVTVASADKFVEKREEKLRLREAGCGICEMELAAIARVCERSHVKCLSIKCISDAFDGTGADFEKNVRNSAKKAFGAIREVLKAL
ncbi:MAG: 5'-methylthioadenosine/S-adenosylhomocysteine nucleosidase [Oscillospiraceae bacterium]|nr:5'-methylthioadenosine/S-adenosylhomocysteine nucleosidase [Oscillospiraceae bacterium]